MNGKMKNAVAIAALIVLTGCGSKDEGKEPRAPLDAPARDRMALDPNPPMSGADIDAIVNQTRSEVAAPQGRPTGGNASDIN